MSGYLPPDLMWRATDSDSLEKWSHEEYVIILQENHEVYEYSYI